jgi:homoserine kinase
MKVTVQVPATTANLGPGFDCLGMALRLHNIVELATTASGLQIDIQGEGIDLLPTNISNLVYRSVATLFQYVGEPVPGLCIRLQNRLPLMGGLGSSSAAIVGGLVAANVLLGDRLTRDDVLKLAVEIEGHPDNVAPALLGGLVVVTSDRTGPVYRRLEVPTFDIVVVTPDFRLSTARARAALPKDIPLADAIFNLGRAALVVHALVNADFDLLSTAMDDRLHQVYRMPLIPGLADVFEAARKSGAAGVALSGAGPSVVAFASGNHAAIAEAMCGAFARAGLNARSMLLSSEPTGAHVIQVDHVPQ